MTEFVINAERRNDVGKGASRRLRRANKVPGVLYGPGSEPVSLTFNHDELIKQTESEAFFSHILTVNVDGQQAQAVVKDMQRHPFKPKIVHMDLQRVTADHKIHMTVPLHFVGQDVAPGVKGGGLLTHDVTEVSVFCLPKDLPEFIEVDVSNLDLGDVLHLSNLKLPKGVELVELSHGPEHDLPVASVHKHRGGEVAEEAAAAPAAAPEAGEEGAA